jgi:hypothetical protein
MEDVLVETRRSATWCISAADTIWLARPEAAGRYALRRHGNVRALAWPPGATRIEWPADLPIEDGDRFELLRDGEAQASIGFRRMPAAANEPAAVAAGILLGCRDQFAAALEQLARSVAPAEAER